MLNNRTLILITLIVLSFSLNAKSQEIATMYNDYFELPRETFFLHLNKTTYIPGEQLFFKGYIYNKQTGTPFNKTTNLIVGIYDSIGNQVVKRRFKAGEGFSQGSFEINSSLASGTYYIKASTQWMRNFYEDDSFAQKITIYNGQIKGPKKAQFLKKTIAFTPEGGSLVSDLTNKVAIRVVDNHGFSLPFKNGIIKDQYGYTHVTFTPGKNNISLVNFTPRPALNYELEVTLNDDHNLTHNIPPPNKGAIALSITDHSESQIAIILKLSKQTRESIIDPTFSLLIHRDGIAKKVTLELPEKVNHATYLFAKSQLQKGINIFSLFTKEDKPIAERIFFNPDGLEINNDIDAPIITRKSTDSLVVSFTKKSKTPYLNTSISVLPYETLSNHPAQNILSTFYIKPYLKNQNIPLNFYFLNGKTNFSELDALLISQGESRFSWKRIRNNPPKSNIPFAQGVTLEGRINTTQKDKEQLFLHAGAFNNSQTINTQNGRFTFSSIFPERNDLLSFSLISKRGRLTRPSLTLVSANNLKEDTFKNIHIKNSTLNSDITTNVAKRLPSISKFEDIEQLNEVILTGKKKLSYESSNPLVPSFLKNKVTPVTEDLVFRQPRFLSIIRSRGYTVREDLQFASTTRVQIRVRTQQSFGVGNDGFERAFPEPVIYYDDVKLIDFDVLTGLRTEDLESFYFQRNGASEGVNGAGGVIRIYTRRNLKKPLSNSSKKEINPVSEIFSYTIDNGFEAKQKFIQPDYLTFNDMGFKNFGIIHWEPEFILKNDTPSSFVMKDTGTNSISFYIEGMSPEGNLISTIKTFHFPKKS